MKKLHELILGVAMTLFTLTACDNEEIQPDAPQVIMGNFSDPNQAVKGDFAMKDGSFISYSENITLTDAQKANVAGIVFWTENEDDGPSTLVGDDVADQAMKTAFPNCTHGLIVSLTNVSESCAWQGIYEDNEQKNYESIYTVFQKEHAIYKDYVAIESGTGSTDNINKILGYNNTQVLEAYNAHCKANNKSDYLVKPIEVLAEWKASNPDITGSTGWFLPSAKELHMLNYKDVADVWETYEVAYVETMNVVNASLEKVGGTQFGDNVYWCSSECADYTDGAFSIGFRDAGMYDDYKNRTYLVRAVCAY